MDITSFGMGISFTVVVGMLAVTVYNLFRLKKMNKELQSLHEMFTSDITRLFSVIDENKTFASMETERVWSDSKNLNSNVTRSLLANIDKLIHRLDRLEREHLGTSRDEDDISRVMRLKKELLND
jgi:hypothetical protein